MNVEVLERLLDLRCQDDSALVPASVFVDLLLDLRNGAEDDHALLLIDDLLVALSVRRVLGRCDTDALTGEVLALLEILEPPRPPPLPRRVPPAPAGMSDV